MIVGLGNPGKRYERTPHNIGFMVLDELASRLGCRLRSGLFRNAAWGEASHAGTRLLLVKPLTFMNESGSAVGPLARRKGLGPADVVVVLDDADLEPGALRVRARGSAGGHKGLQSVLDALGASEVARVRVGIGRGHPNSDLVEHVLSPCPSAMWKELAPAVGRAADAALCVIEHGAEAAMNRFNAKTAAKLEAQRRADGRRLELC